jgi:ABC-2 type transport system permease protein
MSRPGIGARLARLRLKARKYRVAAAVSARERTAYVGGFLGTALSYALFVFVFSRIWRAAYAGRALIAGYGLDQMIWYFIVAEIPAFGFGRFFSTLAEDVKSGQVAYQMARPYGFVGYNLAQGLGKALVDCAAFAAIGCALGLALAGPIPAGPPARVLAAAASVAAAGIIHFLLQLAIAMTAFWAEENEAFFWIYQKLALIAGPLLPIEFLPEAARRIVAWTPFPSISYAPARILAAWPGDGAAAALMGTQLAWLAASALLCQGIYALGRTRLTVNGG